MGYVVQNYLPNIQNQESGFFKAQLHKVSVTDDHSLRKLQLPVPSYVFMSSSSTGKGWHKNFHMNSCERVA